MIAALLVAFVIALGAVIGSGAAAAAPAPSPSPGGGPLAGARPHRAPEAFRPPVDAPVADPFRPPPQPWMAGNRGIEYATRPGSPVGAIGPGRVGFAGPVAGRLVVSVDHPGGLRSSYVGLRAILVTTGEEVGAGDPVGTAGARLHLGVRRGRRYLDPASLWGRSASAGHAVLVPDPGNGVGSSPNLGGHGPTPIPPPFHLRPRPWWGRTLGPAAWPWGR